MYAKTNLAIVFIILLSSIAYCQEFKTLSTDGKLRDSRGIFSKVITTIPKGSSVEIIYNSFEKGFYRVIFNGRAGYLNKKYFNPASETPVKKELAVKATIFSEDFNNNMQGWRESIADLKEFFFRNGQYCVIQKEDGRLTWEPKYVGIDTTEDFLIDASVALNWKQNGGAFLLFGMDENGQNYHAVQIKKEEGKKEVYFGKYIGRAWTGEWKDANLKKHGEQNRIQILKKGSVISYFINNEFIFSKPFESFFGNYIGLGCQGTQYVSFEYITVSQNVQNFNSNKNVYNTKREIETYSYSNTVKLGKIGKEYEIPAELNGVLKLKSFFDYSINDIIVSPTVATTLQKSGTLKNEDWLEDTYYQTSDGSIAQRKRFRLNSVRIGNKTLTNVTCTISNSLGTTMILGHDVLRRFGNYSFNYLDETLTIN